MEHRANKCGAFSHITMMFSEGNFEVPMLVHDETPPGSKVMQQLKGEISYEFKETERGAVIQNHHRQHMTGDPLEIK